MNLSYWEINSWFSEMDVAVVGSGIVGLNTAINIKEKWPKTKVIILEKGALPEGASSKNAGFACMGSLSEILDDLQSHTEDEVVRLVEQRWEGLKLLRTLGDAAIGYEQFGGYEVFTSSAALHAYVAQVDAINTLLKPLFPSPVFSVVPNTFGFAQVNDAMIFNPFEGQIDTGKMIKQLLFKAACLQIPILNNCTVSSYVDLGDVVKIHTNIYDFTCRKLCIATNGFAAQLVDESVRPARAQVLITKPIKGLKLRGTFHLEKGYYYFRNVQDRILLGGGRNLDFKGEETTHFGLTNIIQDELDRVLKEVVSPGQKVEVAHRWSGIMGVGSQKKPIIKALSDHVYCGVRMGGMGIAIGAKVAKEIVNIIKMD